MSATMQFFDDVTRRAELAPAADQAATSSHAAFPATGPA
jgi:hypothetical protein